MIEVICIIRHSYATTTINAVCANSSAVNITLAPRCSRSLRRVRLKQEHFSMSGHLTSCRQKHNATLVNF